MQITSPACTELEVQMMNWFGKMLDLPKEFLNESEGPGGGVIQVFINIYFIINMFFIEILGKLTP